MDPEFCAGAVHPVQQGAPLTSSVVCSCCICRQSRNPMLQRPSDGLAFGRTCTVIFLLVACLVGFAFDSIFLFYVWCHILAM